VSSRPGVRANKDSDRAGGARRLPARGAARADAVHLGLLTSVFTRDLARGLRFAESDRDGWVNINEGTNYWESHLPFGGRAGSQSGLGRVGGRFSIERLTELKTIVVNLA